MGLGVADEVGLCDKEEVHDGEREAELDFVHENVGDSVRVHCGEAVSVGEKEPLRLPVGVVDPEPVMLSLYVVPMTPPVEQCNALSLPFPLKSALALGCRCRMGPHSRPVLANEAGPK